MHTNFWSKILKGRPLIITRPSRTNLKYFKCEVQITLYKNYFPTLQ